MRIGEKIILVIQILTTASMLFNDLFPTILFSLLINPILFLQTLTTFAVVYFLFQNKELPIQPRYLGIVSMLILGLAQLFLTNHFPFPFLDGVILVPIVIFFLYLSFRLYFQRSLFGLWLISIFPTIHALVIMRLLLFEKMNW
jgi:hypothetical protein